MICSTYEITGNNSVVSIIWPHSAIEFNVWAPPASTTLLNKYHTAYTSHSFSNCTHPPLSPIHDAVEGAVHLIWLLMTVPECWLPGYSSAKLFRGKIVSIDTTAHALNCFILFLKDKRTSGTECGTTPLSSTPTRTTRWPRDSSFRLIHLPI